VNGLQPATAREPIVYVVHCVDTEGPLSETLDATFERLKAIYGLNLEPNRQTLEQLQRQRLDVGSPERARAVAETAAPRHLTYLETWDALDAMLDRLDAPAVRMALPDSDGMGWIVNWHCVAHYGFDPALNPRRRHLGVHAIFDHYRQRYGSDNPFNPLHWHFHPVARSRQANHSASAYFTSPVVFEIVSRRILERLWFPCVNRPGFNVERPDSHWFLEQWMPFDIANNNAGESCDQPDVGDGRLGDWRRAPADWVVYHPHHDDYQAPGACRRAIARCLYLGGRFNRITEREVEQAFERARQGPVVMAFFNHDFRDMVPEVQEMQGMLARATRRYPDVRWHHAGAVEAMRGVLGLRPEPHARFDLKIDRHGGVGHRLRVGLDRQPFGPQPWLCYALSDGSVWHDNLDTGLEPRHWHYTFDDQSTPLAEVVSIGLATNTADGRTTVTTLDPATGKQQVAFHN